MSYSCQRRKQSFGVQIAVAAIATSMSFTFNVAEAHPWADEVISYVPGATDAVVYTSDPNVVLGSPERLTGEGVFPSDVTLFNSPFGIDEIISVGAGGHLTVRFDRPITNNPAHAFGVDFIVFGNTFFVADVNTEGDFVVAGSNSEPGTIEVSEDGIAWHTVSAGADSLFPTQGYLDAEIFGTDDGFNPTGSVPTNFLKPVDPDLTLDDFLDKTYAESLALYDGSGGGTPVDIGPTGLSTVSYARVSLPAGGDPSLSSEIDAFAVVPEPATAAFMLLGGFAILRRSRREGWPTP